MNYNYTYNKITQIQLPTYTKINDIKIDIENEQQLKKYVFCQGLKYKFIKNLLPHDNIYVSLQTNNIMEFI